VLAALPYAAWSVWVRVRVGQFPFLTHVRTRSDAFRLPTVGWFQTLGDGADARLAVAVAVATVMLAVFVGWRARAILAGAGAVAAAVLPLCLGPNALQYLGETLRILAFPQVLALVALAYLVGTARSEATEEKRGVVRDRA
jgi:hypothetical protein